MVKKGVRLENIVFMIFTIFLFVHTTYAKPYVDLKLGLFRYQEAETGIDSEGIPEVSFGVGYYDPEESGALFGMELDQYTLADSNKYSIERYETNKITEVCLNMGGQWIKNGHYSRIICGAAFFLGEYTSSRLIYTRGISSKFSSSSPYTLDVGIQKDPGYRIFLRLGITIL
ncbi:MAG: hypothetical protein A2297_06810 [Elusimicrobia bacterium RIFOXYB2_FULL_48_7]|nr:MAG: hypothetical protein A2297_06810 [Elusimicrobia bacterium RIFOXYB2_FULL_48_7]